MMSNRRSVIRLLMALMAISLVPAAARAQEPPAVGRMAVRDYQSELACGARAAAEVPRALARIGAGPRTRQGALRSRRSGHRRGGDVTGAQGRAGYFVRRVTDDRFTEPGSDRVPTISIHTAGWIRIVEVAPEAAIATITRACGAMQQGDFLEPFVLAGSSRHARASRRAGLRQPRPAAARRRQAPDGGYRRPHGVRPRQRPRPAQRPATDDFPRRPRPVGVRSSASERRPR